jgi:hypothetical protein
LPASRRSGGGVGVAGGRLRGSSCPTADLRPLPVAARPGHLGASGETGS